MTWFGLGVQVDERISRYIIEVATGGGGGVGRHASTHIDGGTDPIDSDKLEVTWTPTNYTRDSATPSETNADDQLTAHLQGIDTYLGNTVLDTRQILTGSATSGLTGGGDLSADRTIAYDVNSMTRHTMVISTDRMLVYDVTAGSHKYVEKGDIDVALPVHTYENLSDTVGTLSGNAFKGIRVESDESDLEFTDTLYIGLVAKTADYTALVGDTVVLGDATSGNVTVTLPTAVGGLGKVYNVKKTDSSSNDVIVSSNDIDGATTATLTRQWESIMLVSDNASWMII